MFPTQGVTPWVITMTSGSQLETVTTTLGVVAAVWTIIFILGVVPHAIIVVDGGSIIVLIPLWTAGTETTALLGTIFPVTTVTLNIQKWKLDLSNVRILLSQRNVCWDSASVNAEMRITDTSESNCSEPCIMFLAHLCKPSWRLTFTLFSVLLVTQVVSKTSLLGEVSNGKFI